MSYLDIESGGIIRRRRYSLLDGIDFQAGSSKPTTRSDGSALAVGDRWLDTSGDRIDWRWDGTYWVSDLRSAATTQSTVSATTAQGLFNGLATGNNFILVRLVFSARFNFPQNATDNWSISAERYAAGSNSFTTLNTLTISSLSISSGSESRSATDTLNLHQDINALGSIHYRIALRRNGSAGALNDPISTIVYRLAKP